MKKSLIILFINDDKREHDVFSMALNITGIKYACYFAINYEEAMHHITNHQPQVICVNNRFQSTNEAGYDKFLKDISNINNANIVICNNDIVQEPRNKEFNDEIIFIKQYCDIAGLIKVLKQIFEERFRQLHLPVKTLRHNYRNKVFNL